MPDSAGFRASAAARSPVAAATEPTRSGASGRARSAPARSRSITRPAAVAPPAEPPTPSATATTRAAASPASWLSGRGPAIESAAASRTSVSSPGRTSGSVTDTRPTVLLVAVDFLEIQRRIAAQPGQIPCSARASPAGRPSTSCTRMTASGEPTGGSAGPARRPRASDRSRAAGSGAGGEDRRMTAPTVAVLGTGTVGAGMVRSLRRAGLPVRMWNRDPAKARALTGTGAQAFDAPEEAARGAGGVPTVGAGTHAVEAVIRRAAPAAGTVWVQASTVGVDGVRRTIDTAGELGLVLVDAPVLGTREPAEK